MKTGRQAAARVLTAMVASDVETRRGLQDVLGLSKGAISRTVDALLGEGCLFEGDKQQRSATGRRTTALCVRPDLVYILGADLEGSAVRACILDASRRVVSSGTCRIGSRWSVRRILDEWRTLIDTVIGEARIRPELLACIGLGLPGIVRREGYRSRAYLPPGQWVDVDAEDIVSKIGLPVTVANNTVCVSDYERRIGLASGCASFISILARYGLGAAMYGQGTFLVGEETITCEFGHMRISQDGTPCICGASGCLDVLSSGRTLPSPSRRQGKRWEEELNRRVNALGTGIANLLKVFHPPVVILNGLYNEWQDTVRNVLAMALEEELSGLGLAIPEIVFGEDVELKTSIGAALRAAETHLTEHILEWVLT